ncbi:hypothetical protein HDV00_003411 [Rhizophlyctis rosea]|nr:hypothetical protein HDV00_003411 [Rhizophlyctis rosea]
MLDFNGLPSAASSGFIVETTSVVVPSAETVVVEGGVSAEVCGEDLSAAGPSSSNSSTASHRAKTNASVISAEEAAEVTQALRLALQQQIDPLPQFDDETPYASSSSSSSSALPLDNDSTQPAPENLSGLAGLAALGQDLSLQASVPLVHEFRSMVTDSMKRRGKMPAYNSDDTYGEVGSEEEEDSEDDEYMDRESIEAAGFELLEKTGEEAMAAAGLEVEMEVGSIAGDGSVNSVASVSGSLRRLYRDMTNMTSSSMTSSLPSISEVVDGEEEEGAGDGDGEALLDGMVGEVGGEMDPSAVADTWAQPDEEDPAGSARRRKRESMRHTVFPLLSGGHFTPGPLTKLAAQAASIAITVAAAKAPEPGQPIPKLVRARPREGVTGWDALLTLPVVPVFKERDGDVGGRMGWESVEGVLETVAAIERDDAGGRSGFRPRAKSMGDALRGLGGEVDRETSPQRGLLGIPLPDAPSSSSSSGSQASASSAPPAQGQTSGHAVPRRAATVSSATLQAGPSTSQAKWNPLAGSSSSSSSSSSTRTSQQTFFPRLIPSSSSSTSSTPSSSSSSSTTTSSSLLPNPALIRSLTARAGGRLRGRSDPPGISAAFLQMGLGAAGAAASVVRPVERVVVDVKPLESVTEGSGMSVGVPRHAYTFVKEGEGSEGGGGEGVSSAAVVETDQSASSHAQSPLPTRPTSTSPHSTTPIPHPRASTDSPLDSATCPLCADVCDIPLYLGCCKNKKFVCASCLLRWLREGGVACPFCRSEVQVKNIRPADTIYRIANRLRVRCKEEGCGWVGERREIGGHRRRGCVVGGEGVVGVVGTT